MYKVIILWLHLYKNCSISRKLSTLTQNIGMFVWDHVTGDQVEMDRRENPRRLSRFHVFQPQFKPLFSRAHRY